MTIQIGQNFYNLKADAYILERAYSPRPPQELKNLDCIKNEPPQRFYPFYGATSIRRHTHCVGIKGNRKKINNSRNLPLEKVRKRDRKELERGKEKWKK